MKKLQRKQREFKSKILMQNEKKEKNLLSYGNFLYQIEVVIFESIRAIDAFKIIKLLQRMKILKVLYSIFDFKVGSQNFNIINKLMKLFIHKISKRIQYAYFSKIQTYSDSEHWGAALIEEQTFLYKSSCQKIYLSLQYRQYSQFRRQDSTNIILSLLATIKQINNNNLKKLLLIQVLTILSMKQNSIQRINLKNQQELKIKTSFRNQ